MKKPSRFLRVFGVAGLLISLLAATIAPVGAQDEDGEPLDDFIADLLDVNDGSFRTGDNAIFYPWVANGEDFGLGASQTSISVQNLEPLSGNIAIYVGDGDGGFTLETTAFLSGFAAKTFHADDLGIEEGSGAPVVVIGFDEFTGEGIADDVFVDLEPGEALVETPVILSKPEGVEGDFTQVIACVINDGSGDPVGFAVAAPFTFEGTDYVPGEDDDPNYFVGAFTQAELQAILEDAQAANDDDDDETNDAVLVNPFGGFNNDGDCGDEGIAGTDGGDFLFPVTIGGVAKQAVVGDSLPTTTEADTAVSGYNAINGAELARFEQFYLPIVQTNCGPGGCWDSVIRVANLEGENNAVTIRFFPADDGSGSLQTGFQIQDNVDGGSTWNVNLSDLVPEGWVGSAHILSDGGVFAMVDRYKVGYNMWITNTGSSAGFENAAQLDNAQGNYVLFAPHVLVDYFGWNTGINVANLADADNNVSIQYFNTIGNNATETLNQRLAAHGMTYFYDPSVGAQDNNEQDVTSDPNANTVASALIWSDAPVAVAVDATKYPETDPNGGEDLFQATSYSATQNLSEFQAVPLVQKGSPVDGLGDTSGINIMNPNAVAVTASVLYVNPSGFLADNFGTSSVTIPAFANGFVYTMTQRNLPNGFTGAAQVVASAPVAAVSANVNYAVDGDGSAIFNAFNPCGQFRVAAGDCFFGGVFEPTDQSVTKTFVDELGDPVAEVGFSIVATGDVLGFQRDGFSGEDGSLTMENIPVGEFELFVTDVPDGYAEIDPTVAQDTFTVAEGEQVVLENVLVGDGVTTQGIEKTVVVTGEGETAEAVAGVDVAIFTSVGTDGTGGFVIDGEALFEGVTGTDGTVTSGNLAAGNYVLCVFDTNGTATTGSEADEDLTTVTPVLGSEANLSADGNCELVTVEEDVVTEITNTIEVFEGAEGFDTVFVEGFEDGTADGWLTDIGGTPYGTVEVVPSGTDGIESSSGAFHAIFDGASDVDDNGPFTQFDGYRDEFPVGGFIATIDIYLDVDGWVAGEGFDYSVAANGSDGIFQRDFVFHVAQDTSTGNLQVGASNGSLFATDEDLETTGPFSVISASGWYTFQHVFRDNGAGVLAVDLNVIDSAGTVVFTQTLSEAADTIPAEVGGNRYGWFTFIDVDGGIAVDDTQLQIAE